MVALPKQSYIDPTTARVKVHIEESQSTNPRHYMGMSGMGDVCDRRIWLRFRWALREKFSSTALLAFQDGFTQESIMAERLKRAGFKITTKGGDGRQIAFVELGGHFRGNMDGLIEGLAQAPSKLHVWEHKSTNEKSYNLLLRHVDSLGEKAALFAWKPEYYAQAQLYMHYQGTDRHYMTVSTPGGRDFTGIRTDADVEVALRLRAKAERLIFSDNSPPAMDPTDYRCRGCNFEGLCHGVELPQRSCRTCAHVTPMRDGTWKCEKTGAEALALCNSHRFIPSLVPGKVLSVNGDIVAYELRDGKAFVDRGV